MSKSKSSRNRFRLFVVSKAKIFMKYVFYNEDMLALAQDMARALDEQHHRGG